LLKRKTLFIVQLFDCLTNVTDVVIRTNCNQVQKEKHTQRHQSISTWFHTNF